jgi:DNA polymerase-1
MSSTAPNTQNISKTNPRMRGLFLPDPGHTLLTADFDQVELRVAAAFAGEQSMIDTILAGQDLHQLTADKVGITRQQAKTLNFAVLYGAGARRIAATTGMTEDEAWSTLEGFWQAYPAISALASAVRREREYVITVSGRRVPVRWFKGAPAVHKNLNYLVQGSARECLVDAWWRFDHEFGMGDLVWLPIHDEIVTQVPDDRVAEVAKAIESCMSFDLCGVPITATAVALIDEDGVSRWMTADRAEKVAAARAEQASAA